MAARGAPKLIEYRVPITSVRQWLREVETPPSLLVVELYTTLFGSCQVILPTINNIMLAIDDATNKLKWLTVNVSKLEEEQRQLLVEEEKKRNEGAGEHGSGSTGGSNEPSGMLQRRPSVNNDHSLEELKRSGMDAEEGTPLQHARPLNGGSHATTTKTSTWEKVYIPKLERYSGYDHPRPLWLFIQNGTLLYTLDSPNPPKMQRIITAILNDQHLTEEDLSQYDFIATTVDDIERRKARKIKAEQDKRRAAVEKRKSARIAKEAAKPVIQRAGEWLVFNTIELSAGTEWKHSAVLVVYSKDEASGEYLHFQQTELVKPHNNAVTFATPITWLHTEADGEFKCVLYDTQSADIAKGRELTTREDCTPRAEVYIPIPTIIQAGENEDKSAVEAVQFKLVQPRPATAAAPTTMIPDASAEQAIASLKLNVRSSMSEGIVSQWRFTPTITTSEALNTEAAYVVCVAINDLNHGDYAHLGHSALLYNAEAQTYTAEQPILLQSFSNVDRSVRLSLHPAEEFSTAALHENVIATGELKSLNDVLEQRKQSLHRTVTCTLTTEQQITLQSTLQILSADCDDEEDEIDSGLIQQVQQILQSNIGSSQTAQLSVKFTVNGLQLPASEQPESAAPQLTLVLYQQDHTTNMFEYLSAVTFSGSSTATPAAAEATLAFSKSLLIPKPSPSATVDSVENPTPIYQAIVYTEKHAVPEGSTEGTAPAVTHEPLASTTFSLNPELLAAGQHHTFPALNAATNEPLQHTHFNVSIVDVGVVQTVNLAFIVNDSESTESKDSVVTIYSEDLHTQQEVVIGSSAVSSSEAGAAVSSIAVQTYSTHPTEVRITLSQNNATLGSVELTVPDYIHSITNLAHQRALAVAEDDALAVEAEEEENIENKSSENKLTDQPLALEYPLLLNDEPINEGRTLLAVQSVAVVTEGTNADVTHDYQRAHAVAPPPSESNTLAVPADEEPAPRGRSSRSGRRATGAKTLASGRASYSSKSPSASRPASSTRLTLSSASTTKRATVGGKSPSRATTPLAPKTPTSANSKPISRAPSRQTMPVEKASTEQTITIAAAEPAAVEPTQSQLPATTPAEPAQERAAAESTPVEVTPPEAEPAAVAAAPAEVDAVAANDVTPAVAEANAEKHVEEEKTQAVDPPAETPAQ